MTKDGKPGGGSASNGHIFVLDLKLIVKASDINVLDISFVQY